jgi:P2 family phage contractile tail tube protein
MSQLPMKLTHFNLFVDGKGFAGLVTEITLPKLTMKTEEHLSGGMDAPIEIEMGMEKLESSFVMASYDPHVFRMLGIRQGGAIALIARGALKRHDEVTPMTITMRGKIKEIDMGAWKKGGETSMTFSVSVEYYRLDQGIENLIEVDIPNLVRRIGGFDQLSSVRDALLI